MKQQVLLIETSESNSIVPLSDECYFAKAHASVRGRRSEELARLDVNPPIVLPRVGGVNAVDALVLASGRNEARLTAPVNTTKWKEEAV